MLLAGREKWLAWGRLVLGFGMLLFGLDSMKTSMEQVATLFDVSVLKGYPAVVYLLVGVLFTALIQSSSATMMITLSALHVGIVDLPSAAALVIGAEPTWVLPAPWPWGASEPPPLKSNWRWLIS